MATTNPAEEIIEKRDTSALAVTCLVIACAALLGAIVFQLMELGEYKRGGVNAKYAQHKTPAQKKADDDIKAFKERVGELLSKTAEAAGAAGATEEGAGAATEGGATEDAEPADARDADAGDAGEADADGKEAGATDAGAGDEAPADEAPADGDAEEK
jgi:hypothetical protein